MKTFREAGSVTDKNHMRIRKEQTISDEAKLIATASDALAHPLRVELFKHIYKENMRRRGVCTKQLVELFGCSQSTISQHMKKIVISGLVQTKRENNCTNYYINLGMLSKYLSAVKQLNAL